VTGSQRCVTANLEKGHKPGTREWIERAVESNPAVLFLQEFRDLPFLEALGEQHGYVLIRPVRVDPRWWVVSSILVRSDLNPRPLEPGLAGVIDVFDSYVAGALLHLPSIGDTVALSVHASPSAVTERDLERWPRPLPDPRDGGAGRRRHPTLFYSDLVLEAIHRLAEQMPVLAAGDFNEAREWDTDPRHQGHTWGQEYFDRLRSYRLIDVTYRLWQEERRTRFHPSDPALQLDRVIATPDVERCITGAALDPGWGSDPDLAVLADHTPVWFDLTA
jgi:hypothetical protein